MLNYNFLWSSHVWKCTCRGVEESWTDLLSSGLSPLSLPSPFHSQSSQLCQNASWASYTQCNNDMHWAVAKCPLKSHFHCNSKHTRVFKTPSALAFTVSSSSVLERLFFAVNEATSAYINRGDIQDEEIKGKALCVGCWWGNFGVGVSQHLKGTRKFEEAKGLLWNVVDQTLGSL